jgi:hypothetical protein
VTGIRDQQPLRAIKAFSRITGTAEEMPNSAKSATYERRALESEPPSSFGRLGDPDSGTANGAERDGRSDYGKGRYVDASTVEGPVNRQSLSKSAWARTK